jgi:hypothetical protein
MLNTILQQVLSAVAGSIVYFVSASRDQLKALQKGDTPCHGGHCSRGIRAGPMFTVVTDPLRPTRVGGHILGPSPTGPVTTGEGIPGGPEMSILGRVLADSAGRIAAPRKSKATSNAHTSKPLFPLKI